MNKYFNENILFLLQIFIIFKILTEMNLQFCHTQLRQLASMNIYFDDKQKIKSLFV